MCRRWNRLIVFEGPRWKEVRHVKVKPAADVAALRIVARLCPNLRHLFVEYLEIDEGIAKALCDLIDGCCHFLCLHLHRCVFLSYDGWDGLRPVFSVTLSNCIDADGNFPDGRSRSRVRRLLYEPLSMRVHSFRVQYNFAKEYSTRDAWITLFSKQNDRLWNVLFPTI